MSLKILKNKGVPFNNGILLFDYYLQLDEMHLFNFKVYQDKNTNIIKYISSCNNIIYKTDDNYLNIYNISFDEFSEFDTTKTSSEEYQYKVVLLFINLVIDYIKNSEIISQQTMYINLYHFINNCIKQDNNTNNDNIIDMNTTINNSNILVTGDTTDTTDQSYSITTKVPTITYNISHKDIIIPFIETKTTVNAKYKYVPVLLCETGRGTFTDWDFLKELYKLDNFDLFEKYKNSLEEYNIFFDINLDSFDFNIQRDLKNSYNENKFIYSAGLDDSFNRVIEDININNKNIRIFSDTYEYDLNNLDNLGNLILSSNNTLKIIFNMESENENLNIESFDFEYSVYDNIFNKLDEHFEINLIIESSILILEIKNIKETYYQEQFYITLDVFNIYYTNSTTKIVEILKIDVIDSFNIINNIKFDKISIINNYNNQDEIEYIIILPEDKKVLTSFYDERTELNENTGTIFLSFEILDCNIKPNIIYDDVDNQIDIIDKINLTTFFDTSIINILDYYNGKEIQLSLINNLNLNDGTIYDKDIINDNFYINTNLVLFLTFPCSSKKFSTYINFIGSSSSKFRIFVLNNTSLFFDTELIEYQKTNLYGFLLPCGKNYIDNKNYFVGYNKKTGYIEQFESYDNIKTLSNILCYVDEINTNNDNTLKDLTVDFKLSENFNASIWNDFYLLYKDKKINNITMN